MSGREQEELERLAEARRVASLREIRLQVMSPVILANAVVLLLLLLLLLLLCLTVI